MSSTTELFNFTEFKNIILEEYDDVLLLKTNVKNAEEVERWKLLYCKNFNTCLNVAYNYKTNRSTLHRRYRCIFGEKTHKGKKKTFLGCTFTLNIKIKLITKNTLQKDKQLKEYPCYVTIQGKHKDCTESEETLKQLRVLPEIREDFMRYFSLGMTPPQAAQFHEEKLGLNPEMVPNNAINPTMRSIIYMHRCWREKEYQAQQENAEEPVRPASEVIDEINDVLSELNTRLGDKNTSPGLEAMLKKLKSVESANQLNSWLFDFGSSLSTIPAIAKGKLPCKPIIRRKRGRPKGSGKGVKRKRPTKEEKEKKQQAPPKEMIPQIPRPIENNPGCMFNQGNVTQAVECLTNMQDPSSYIPAYSQGFFGSNPRPMFNQPFPGYQTAMSGR